MSPPLSTSAPHFVCSGESTAILAFVRVFRPGTYFYSPWGGTSSILEGHRPKMYSSGTGPVTFFRGTILAWETHFSLGGEQAVIWGARPRNAPRGGGPEWSSVRNKLKPKKRSLPGFGKVLLTMGITTNYVTESSL